MADARSAIADDLAMLSSSVAAEPVPLAFRSAAMRFPVLQLSMEVALYSFNPLRGRTYNLRYCSLRLCL